MHRALATEDLIVPPARPVLKALCKGFSTQLQDLQGNFEYGVVQFQADADHWIRMCTSIQLMGEALIVSSLEHRRPKGFKVVIGKARKTSDENITTWAEIFATSMNAWPAFGTLVEDALRQPKIGAQMRILRTDIQTNKIAAVGQIPAAENPSLDYVLVTNGADVVWAPRDYHMPQFWMLKEQPNGQWCLWRAEKFGATVAVITAPDPRPPKSLFTVGAGQA